MSDVLILIGIAVIIPIIILFFMYRSASEAVERLDNEWRTIIEKPLYVPGIGIWITYMILYLLDGNDLSNFGDFLSVTLGLVLVLGLLWIPIYKISKNYLIKKLENSFCDDFIDYEKIREEFQKYQREIKRIFKSDNIGVTIDCFRGVLIFSYYWKCSRFSDPEFSIKVYNDFREINELYKPDIPWWIEKNYEDFGGDVAQFTYYDVVYYIEIPSKSSVSYETIKKGLADKCGIRVKKLER